MDHDAVVKDWKQNAERNDDENYKFLRSMKHREYGFDPDELAHELHERAFQIVDTVYDIRPTVCREYPHTNKEGLVFRTMGVANNALVCPAVFWIVEQMKRQALG